MPDLSRNNDAPNLSGVYAALITPVDDQGQPEREALLHLVDFVVERGVDGICIGGGTAEYPHFSLEHRKLIVEYVARHLDGHIPFVTSIGAPTMRGVLELGEHALRAGSSSLLVPMPFFFRYGQEDLAAYVREVVRSLDAPCILYNLAAFTNPLDPETSLSLLHAQPNLIGIKDSSGDRQALRTIQEGRGDAPFALMVGSDGLFLDALNAGWDGGISGIASCCPEVLVALYAHHRAGQVDEARRCQNLLDELVTMVDRLPFPWSIRLAADVRGFPNGPLPYPLSEERRAQAAELRKDYVAWFDKNLGTLS